MKVHVVLRTTDGVEHTLDPECWGNRDYETIEQAEFSWREGNCSCDCTRGDFIARTEDYDDPDLPCGDTIKLVSLTNAETGADLLEEWQHEG